MPHLQLRAFPNRIATALMATLLLIGLYFPTSLDGRISTRMYLLHVAILCSVLLVLLLRKRGILSMSALVNAAAINVILIVCTLFAPFNDFAYGGYIPLFALTMLFCVGMRDVSLTAATRRLFDAANIVNIVLGVLLLLRAPGVTQFFLDNYAYAYEELVPYMLEEGKPVLMFGAHSLAGFFFYMFFYLTFETFVATRSKLNLVFAFCYIALLTTLSSFTSLVFVAVALIQIIAHFQWHKSAPAGLIATALLLAAAAVVVPRMDALDDFKSDLVDLMNREDNGLIGRYSSSGGLSGDLEYIASHPFQPIGFAKSNQFWYADSGPVEYVLKGSFPLLFTVYAGILMFFYKNLKSRRRATFLLLVFLAFELGFSNLEYIRTQCFLPFLVVYLNGLDSWKLAAIAEPRQ